MSTWLQPRALIGLQPTIRQGFGQVCMWHGLTSEVLIFHGDENSDSSWNVHVLAGHTPDTIASPKKFSEFRYCEGFRLEWYFYNVTPFISVGESLKFQRNMIHIFFCPEGGGGTFLWTFATYNLLVALPISMLK